MQARSGSIISPLLSNIFMHQLDTFVDELKKEFDVGVKSKPTEEALKMHYLITKANKGDNKEEVVRLAKESRKIA